MMVDLVVCSICSGFYNAKIVVSCVEESIHVILLVPESVYERCCIVYVVSTSVQLSSISSTTTESQDDISRPLLNY